MPHATPRARLERLADAARSSLWVVPGGCILAAIAAAAAAVALDRRVDRLVAPPRWLFHATAEGARATLSTIAGAVLTVAGLSFSITIVVLQLASSQFSPRVVRNFARDRLIQAVLGAYMGTFTYALVALRSVRDAVASPSPSFVAPVSVPVATALALVCMVMLVVFVHHVARSVQVPAILEGVAREVRVAIDRLYAEPVGAPTPAPSTAPPLPTGTPVVLRAPRTGYLEHLDEGGLEHAPRGSTVEVLVRAGDFVRAGDAIARVWTPGAPAEVDVRPVAGAFTIEDERSIRQDVRFGFRRIADLAVRALSPGINDPTTAVYCVNVLGDLLGRLATRVPPPAWRVVASRDVRVHAPRPDFAEFAWLAFGQVLAYGRGDAHVVTAVAAALEAVGARDVTASQRDVLRAIADHAGEVSADASWSAYERARVAAALGRVASS